MPRPVRHCRAILLIPFMLAPAVGCAFSDASPWPTITVADAVAAARGAVSLDQAVSMVLGRYGGKVIRAETRSHNGRTIHSIKLLTDDGRVRTVQVDGETGQIF